MSDESKSDRESSAETSTGQVSSPMDLMLAMMAAYDKKKAATGSKKEARAASTATVLKECEKDPSLPISLKLTSIPAKKCAVCGKEGMFGTRCCGVYRT